MLISWDDVNRTERMGDQLIERLGVRVFIQQQAINNWKDGPRGRHELIKAKTPLSGPLEYGLGKFHPSK